MADLFETYEEDFIEITGRIEQRIRNIPQFESIQRRSEAQKAELQIKDADQLLRSMNLSAQSVPSNPKLKAKVKEYESELTKLKSSVRKAEAQISAVADRTDLFAGGIIREEMAAAAMDQREHLLKSTDKLDKSTIELKQTLSVAEETVGVGVEVMENLDRQRDQMLRMRETLRGVQEQIGKAQRIMRAMAKRVITNKLIMAVIVLVLLGAIALIVYMKWFSGNSSNNPTTTTGSTTGVTSTSTSTSTTTTGIPDVF